MEYKIASRVRHLDRGHGLSDRSSGKRKLTSEAGAAAGLLLGSERVHLDVWVVMIGIGTKFSVLRRKDLVSEKVQVVDGMSSRSWGEFVLEDLAKKR